MTWTTRPRFEGPGALAYWRVGSGPAVLLIHGVGLQAEAWSWVADTLARNYTVYALDIPGHGASPLSGAVRLEDYIARVLSFPQALKGRVYLAGHFMGAMTAIAAAVHTPHKIAGFAALNAIYQRTSEAKKAVGARAKALVTDGGNNP